MCPKTLRSVGAKHKYTLTEIGSNVRGASIALAAVDAYGCVHQFIVPARFGWHFMHGHAAEEYRDWSVSAPGCKVDRVVIPSSSAMRAVEMFSVRLVPDLEAANA